MANPCERSLAAVVGVGRPPGVAGVLGMLGVLGIDGVLGMDGIDGGFIPPPPPMPDMPEAGLIGGIMPAPDCACCAAGARPPGNCRSVRPDGPSPGTLPSSILNGITRILVRTVRHGLAIRILRQLSFADASSSGLFDVVAHRCLRHWPGSLRNLLVARREELGLPIRAIWLAPALADLPLRPATARLPLQSFLPAMQCRSQRRQRPLLPPPSPA